MEIPEPDIITYAWFPRGVKYVIASGGNNFSGLVDENTVLMKGAFPSVNGELAYKQLEVLPYLSAVIKEGLRYVLSFPPPFKHTVHACF